MSGQPICTRPWTGFELYDHLGDVRPCCWGKLSCGNLNDETPAQIWNGNGFKHYRELMQAGAVESICSPSCPILQGQYTERGPESPEADAPEFSMNVVDRSPLYLRVVPTTKCNLRCTMCYQAGSPSPRLPDNLFELLSDWLRDANELLILGGETFIARECLDWVEKVTPAEFPSCRLAAITNGLGFNSSVCKLIAERQWSWILISIDAASEAVYKEVRGGSFAKVLVGLQAIVEVRSIQPFELRLGFTLQKSNLQDAVDFIDLCADFEATPQFTMVVGDWHGESPSDVTEFQRFLTTTELIDKRLAERGFSSSVISTLLASLKAKSTMWTSPSRTNLHGYTLSEGVAAQSKSDSFSNLRIHRDGTSLLFEVLGKVDRDPTRKVVSSIRSAPTKSCRITIPFFADDRALSVWDVHKVVDLLLTVAAQEGIREIISEVDLAALGLDLRDCTPHSEIVAESSRRPTASELAIVTPVCNRGPLLPLFLKSLLPQLTDRDELILVDDGSMDGSRETALNCIRAFPGSPRYRLLSCKRQQRYSKGTFTFGAGVARQIGVAHTDAEMLLFIDPDQVVASGCLEGHRFFLNHGFDVVMGDRREPDGDIETPWRILRAKAINSRPDWWLSFCTANVSVRRSIFEDVGGFDSGLQYWGLDDTDLGFRLFAKGARVWHTLRSQVVHLDPEGSGAGTSSEERSRAYRLHCEVMYRKYLLSGLLEAFSFLQ